MDKPHSTSSWLDSPYLTGACLALIAVFYLGTLVVGQNWSGDFSHYIHHAKNLVEGKHYLDTNYLLNSFGVFVGPYAYPPVYPLLLAPVIWIAGVDVEWLKWVGNCFFIASLWLALLCFKPRLKYSPLIVIGLVALNPFIWSFRNNILSDFPFTFFCFLALLVSMIYFERDKDQPQSLQATLLWGLLIGICCYLSFGTREIGVVTPLTFLTYDIVCRRKISVASLVMGATFIGLALLQSKLLSGTFVSSTIEENLNNLTSEGDTVHISHLAWVSLDPELILYRITGYRYAIQDFWISYVAQKSGLELLLNKLAFNLTTLLAVIGYLRCLLQKITVLEIFIAGYIAVLLLFGAPPTLRYLIPLFPLFLYYALLGIECLGYVLKEPYIRWATVSWFLATALLFTWQLPNIDYERFEKGIYHAQAQEMFEFVRSSTDPDDTIIYRKPRVLALYTGRKSAAYPNQHHATKAELEQYFDALEGDYYIDMKLEDWMLPLTDSEPPTEKFSLAFRNTYFAIYKYSP